jgi:hypothetical protein
VLHTSLRWRASVARMLGQLRIEHDVQSCFGQCGLQAIWVEVGPQHGAQMIGDPFVPETGFQPAVPATAPRSPTSVAVHLGSSFQIWVLVTVPVAWLDTGCGT